MSDLPPLDQPQAYVVVGPNDQRGPYTLELLIGEVLAGRLRDETPVWWPGLAEWTTLAAHPGVAAELGRRRAGYADPQAFAPAPEPQQPAPGQYEEAAGWGTTAPGQPTAAVSGQDYSADMYTAGQQVAASPAIDPTPAQDPFAPVAAVEQTPAPAEAAPVEPQQSTQLFGEVVAAEVSTGAVESPSPFAAAAEPVAEPAAAVVEPEPAAAVVEPEVVAPDQVGSPSAGVDPAHRAAFDDLVSRSRARTAGADAVSAADAALVAAVAAAASDAGYHETERSTGDARHEMKFEGQPGETLFVHLGRVTGDDAEAARADDVPLEVLYQSSRFGGEVEVVEPANGEVVVVADEWTGQATSKVALRLPLADYLGSDLSVDSDAVGRDVSAVIAVVRSRMD